MFAKAFGHTVQRALSSKQSVTKKCLRNGARHPGSPPGRRDTMVTPWPSGDSTPASRSSAKLVSVTFKMGPDDLYYRKVLRMQEGLHTFVRCTQPSHYFEVTACRLWHCFPAIADAMTRLILFGCWLDCWLLARLAGWLARFLAGWPVGSLDGWLSIHPTKSC